MKGAKTEYHWTLTGTNAGLGGTGKFVKISGFEEWRFGPDGLIAESLGHFDAADYQRQWNSEFHFMELLTSPSGEFCRFDAVAFGIG